MNKSNSTAFGADVNLKGVVLLSFAIHVQVCIVLVFMGSTAGVEVMFRFGIIHIYSHSHSPQEWFEQGSRRSTKHFGKSESAEGG